MSKISSIAFCCMFLGATLTGCSEQKSHAESFQPNKKQAIMPRKSFDNQKQANQLSVQSITEQNQSGSQTNQDTIQVVTKPDSNSVLVNKQNKLPDEYIPEDLVYTTIPFMDSQKTEKQKMRKVAADAIAQLFAGAKQQGIHLLGVSAYRSYTSQLELFNSYVKTDGYQKARTYSALPGTSEHETGLAIDVTGGNGQCAAQECFGNTKEAEWLQANAAKYGFIIRYPQGKESITGYEYEPWHLRYVGRSIAEDIMSHGMTLEEYSNTAPVHK